MELQFAKKAALEKLDFNQKDEIITPRVSRNLINKFYSLSYKNFTLFL